MQRWALKSERIVTGDRLIAGHVWIDGRGRIEYVGPAAPSRDVAVRDVGNLVVSPGLVDCHVHINEPGRTDWEGYETATRAAAAGGVTSLVDMPLNCLPVTTTAHALALKLDACQKQCWVDVGFWGGVIPGNESELPALARGGVLGCKAFMVHSGIDEFPNASEDDLRAAMPVLRAHGLPLLAHAELDLGAHSTEQDPRAYQSYLASRPSDWEDAAIALLIPCAARPAVTYTSCICQQPARSRS
jgi:allantoinase